MPEVGEPSQVREEETHDLHVVHEELVAQEPEPDPEEEDPEDEDPEEEIPENSPTTEEMAHDEMIANAIDTINGLEIKVLDLEEQIVSQQELLVLKEAEVQSLRTEKAESDTEKNQLRNEIQQLKAEKVILMEQLRQEETERKRMEDAWVQAARRVDVVEREVRAKKIKIDDMKYAYRSAAGRAQDRIFHHPPGYGQYRDNISREIAIDIIGQEWDEAVHREMFPGNPC